MQTELDIVRDVSTRLSNELLCPAAPDAWQSTSWGRSQPADARRIVDLFSPDYYVSEEAVRESVFNLVHNEGVIKVDCLVRKIRPIGMLSSSGARRSGATPPKVGEHWTGEDDTFRIPAWDSRQARSVLPVWEVI